jgi:hypothetical protein
MVRDSFLKRPVEGTGKGCGAQRAVLSGGTLATGKVAVKWVTDHGYTERGLVNRVVFRPRDVITLYGGEERPRPLDGTGPHTHTRVIPETRGQRVLDGASFASTFPGTPPPSGDVGSGEGLHPECDPELSQLIMSTGIGYMANSPITYCPLGVERPNVTVTRIPMGRLVPGIGYNVLVALTCGGRTLEPGTTLLCEYRPKLDLPQHFQFHCRDRAHYLAAGVPFPEEVCNGDRASL